MERAKFGNAGGDVKALGELGYGNFVTLAETRLNLTVLLYEARSFDLPGKNTWHHVE